MTERTTIATSPKLRPYGSRMQFEIGPTSQFAFPTACTIFPDNDYIIGFKFQESNNSEGLFTDSVEVMGSTSACKAEELGFRLSQGIMWAAISRNVPIRLKYHTPLALLGLLIPMKRLSIIFSVFIGGKAFKERNLMVS